MYENYPSQTKIWEGGTKDEIRIFEALFKGVSTRFWLRTIEKCFENPDFIFCSSFPNLRLGSIKIVSRDLSAFEVVATLHNPRDISPMKCHWKLDPSTFGGTFVSTAYSVMDLKIRTLTAHTNAPVQLT
jgi:hypothetical protein